MPTLRPVPDRPRRGLGMVRVSKAREEMVSPEVQRNAILDYAAVAGIEIVDWLEGGIDESGSRARSAWWPRLDQAVAAVESHEYDVIVVWKFSRTARHRLRWAVAVDRVESAGGSLESATERVDTTTSTGRFTRGMLAELNAFEAERIGEVWTEVHDRRVRAGLPASGKPKWGYIYDLDQRLHVPDPELAPVLAALYRRYTTGEGMLELAVWLNDRGIRTTSNGAWTDTSLRRVLDAGFATGRFRRRGELVAGVHEAVIDEGTWLAYLDARAARRGASNTLRSEYVLSGLLRCGGCGGRMAASTPKPNQGAMYRCTKAKKQGAGSCPTGGCTVLSRIVENRLRAWLAEVADEVDKESPAELEVDTDELDAERARRQVARVQDRLTRLAVQNAEDPLPAPAWRGAYEGLMGQLQRAEAELEDAERLVRRRPDDSRGAAAALLEQWDELPVRVCRELLGRLVAYVTVTRGPLRRDAKGRRVTSSRIEITPTW